MSVRPCVSIDRFVFERNANASPNPACSPAYLSASASMSRTIHVLRGFRVVHKRLTRYGLESAHKGLTHYRPELAIVLRAIRGRGTHARSRDLRQDVVLCGHALQVRIAQATVIVDLHDAEVAAVLHDELQRRGRSLLRDECTLQLGGC